LVFITATALVAIVAASLLTSFGTRASTAPDAIAEAVVTGARTSALGS
jgi:hypothetical protein